MPNIIKHELKYEEVSDLDAPVEQLTRVVGFFTKGDGPLLARSFGSGFFDPLKRGFLVTAAHNLVTSYGPASSVKVKGYTASGRKFALWGLAFAVLRGWEDAGVGADIAVIWLQHDPIVAEPARLQRPGDGYFSAYLRAYNSDVGFDLHEPESSAFKTLAGKDRLTYQSATGTQQMSGAPVIRAGKSEVVGVHKGIVDGQYVAARIDLNLLNALYGEF